MEAQSTATLSPDLVREVVAIKDKAKDRGWAQDDFAAYFKELGLAGGEWTAAVGGKPVRSEVVSILKGFSVHGLDPLPPRLAGLARTPAQAKTQTAPAPDGEDLKKLEVAEANRGAVLAHLEHLFGDLPANQPGLVEVAWTAAQATPDGRHPLNDARQFDPADLYEIADELVRRNATPGRNAYLSAGLRRADVDPNRRGADLDVIGVTALWADMDDAGAAEHARERVTALGIPPTKVVQTASTPHTRVQFWWKLEDVATDLDLCSRLMKRLTQELRGDPSVTNPSRVMRAAGSIGWPLKAGRQREAVRFLDWFPPAEAYALEHLQRVVEGVGQTAAQPPPSARSAGGLAAALRTRTSYAERALRDEVWEVRHTTEGRRNDGLNRSAFNLGQLVASGELDEQTVREELLAAALSVGLSADEAQKTIESGLSSGKSKPREPREARPAANDAPHQSGPRAQQEAGTPFLAFNPWDKYVVPGFPEGVLPPKIEGFVDYQSMSIGACRNGVAAATLVALSAAISHDFRLKMYGHGDWHSRPRLWTLLAGDPSNKKTPIMNAVVEPFGELDAKARADYDRRLAQWQEAVEEGSAKKSDKPKPPRRYIIGNNTVEIMAEIVARTPHGILHHRDELSEFIGSNEKYNGAKAGAADRGFHLKTYDGGRYTVDRVSRGELVVPNLSVSFLAGIQPDRLAELGSLTSDGLLQRFLPVMLSSPSLPEPLDDDSPVEHYHKLVSYLSTVQPVRLTCESGAHDVTRELQEELFALEQSGAFSKSFTGFLGKLMGVHGSLMLVLHMAADPENGRERQIERRTAIASARLIREFFIPHALEFYRSSDDKTDGDTLRATASYILASDLDRFRSSDFTSNVHQLRGLSLWDLHRKLSPLVAGGWLTPEDNMPTCRAWLIEPGLRAAFEARAEQEKARRAKARELLVSLQRGGRNAA